MYQCILCVNSKIRKGILKRLIFKPQTLIYFCWCKHTKDVDDPEKSATVLYATELLYIVETNRR